MLSLRRRQATLIIQLMLLQDIVDNKTFDPNNVRTSSGILYCQSILTICFDFPFAGRQKFLFHVMESGFLQRGKNAQSQSIRKHCLGGTRKQAEELELSLPLPTTLVWLGWHGSFVLILNSTFSLPLAWKEGSQSIWMLRGGSLGDWWQWSKGKWRLRQQQQWQQKENKHQEDWEGVDNNNYIVEQFNNYAFVACIWSQ